MHSPPSAQRRGGEKKMWRLCSPTVRGCEGALVKWCASVQILHDAFTNRNLQSVLVGAARYLEILGATSDFLGRYALLVRRRRCAD